MCHMLPERPAHCVKVGGSERKVSAQLKPAAGLSHGAGRQVVELALSAWPSAAFCLALHSFMQQHWCFIANCRQHDAELQHLPSGIPHVLPT